MTAAPPFSPPRVAICYHHPCADGYAAAVAAFVGLALLPSVLDGAPHTSASLERARAAAGVAFHPLAIYESESSRTARICAAVGPATVVYLLDFSGGLGFIRALCAAAARVVLLDHHKTAAEDVAALRAALPPNLEVHFDMERSGATLARDHFGLAAPGAPLAASCGGPAAAAALLRLLELVEDHDLWRHAHADSTALAAGLAAAALDMDLAANGDALAFAFRLDLPALLARGRAAEAATRALVDAEVARAYTAVVPGAPPLRCLAVLTAQPQLRSEIGNALARASAARGLDPAAIVAYEERAAAGAPGGAPQYKVSWRSLGSFDTTPWARRWGGGGHANAASAMVPAAEVDAWRAADEGQAAAAAAAAAAPPPL